jgi:spore coat protein U-like protein
MKNTIRLIAAAALLAAGLPLAASAQTISISASVASQCNIGNATVALGALTLLSGTIYDTGNTISLTCNKGATVVVALNNGANASGTQKRMTNGTDFINYNFSQPTLPLAAAGNTCPGTPGTEWNGTNTIAGTPMFAASGGPRSIPLCVSVPTPQFPGSGAYTDTVTATLTVS